MWLEFLKSITGREEGKMFSYGIGQTANIENKETAERYIRKGIAKLPATNPVIATKYHGEVKKTSPVEAVPFNPYKPNLKFKIK